MPINTRMTVQALSIWIILHSRVEDRTVIGCDATVTDVSISHFHLQGRNIIWCPLFKTICWPAFRIQIRRRVGRQTRKHQSCCNIFKKNKQFTSLRFKGCRKYKLQQNGPQIYNVESEAFSTFVTKILVVTQYGLLQYVRSVSRRQCTWGTPCCSMQNLQGVLLVSSYRTVCLTLHAWI